MTETAARIVVIGGGYAGALAANHLLQRDDVDITLVNARPQFVERIRLHQLAIGNDDAVADYAELLGARVRLVVDTAHRIDTAARRVELASGAALDYDHLIYAVGSTGGAAPEFAYRLGELEDAHRLAVRLRELPADAPIVVVGTTRDPATPYEWSERLEKQLENGRLVSYDGDGHTAYGRGSECVDSAIDSYLLEGKNLPEKTTC